MRWPGSLVGLLLAGVVWLPDYPRDPAPTLFPILSAGKRGFIDQPVR